MVAQRHLQPHLNMIARICSHPCRATQPPCATFLIHSWARGGRTGGTKAPPLAARHSQSVRVNTEFFWTNFYFQNKSDVRSDFRCPIWCQISVWAKIWVVQPGSRPQQLPRFCSVEIFDCMFFQRKVWFAEILEITCFCLSLFFFPTIFLVSFCRFGGK